MDHPPPTRVRLFRNDTLGSGSYGVVCKAVCGQRLCAAKLLHPIFFQSNDPGIATTRRRFEQECHFLNEMNHPHVVEYLGTTHDPDSGLLVLLMELMDENLAHFLERSQQPLAYHVEVDLCHDIAQAIAYIHSKEIIHRDLSGNNILLTAGRAKITDFGMSKLLDANRRMTPLTMCPGTLVYMPPEAIREPPVYSKKIDCFSFGVLQIQIMTRQFPDPGPAMRVVKDTRSPTGTINVPVLDSERRKSHIDLIDPTHTLLQMALECLKYLEEDRPSAQDLCRQLATLKEAPCYTQSKHAQHIHQLRLQLQSLQQELQTKDQQLQDSRGNILSLQRESQREIQRLAHQVEEKQHAIDDREAQLEAIQQELLQSEQKNRQLQAENGRLRQETEQAVKDKQKGQRQLQELNQQLQANKGVVVEFQQNGLQHEQAHRQLQDTVGRPRLHLQEKQTVERQFHRELNQPEQAGAQPRAPIPDIRRWRVVEESKAPEKIYRGSVAADSNVAYFNGYGSTRVHSYDSDTRKWNQLPDTPHKYFTLAVVRHMLTMVGGRLSSNEPTNSLLRCVGEGRDKKWQPYVPVLAMPTKRYNTAVVCSGRYVIIAGGHDTQKKLTAVEVLDTDYRQWFIASSLTHPFSLATISICGERLYMMGGCYQTGTKGTLSVCSCSLPELLLSCKPQPLAGKLEVQTAPDNQSTIWKCVADAKYYLSTSTTLGGQLVAVGGSNKAGRETADITVYDERTDSWRVSGDMPTARRWALAAVLNGKMMIVGGRIGEAETNVVETLS